MNFSYFHDGGIKNTSKSSPVDLAYAFKLITSDRFKDKVEKLRAATDKSIIKVLKNDLDYFTFSGVFKKREDAGMESHSGLICIDFDKLEDLPGTKEKLLKDPMTALLFVSPTGTGLKCVVRMDGKDHLAAFHYLEGYYNWQYKLQVDKACKDVSRACFVSYDPDCFFNPDSMVLEIPSDAVNVDKETGEVLPTADPIPEGKEKQFKLVEAYVRKIEEMKVDMASDYNDWLMICFSLSIFGEEGRKLFHRVSCFSEKYNEKDADEKFTNALKTSRFTTPDKFFSIAKSYNVKIKKIRQAAEARSEGVPKEYDTVWQYWDMQYKTFLELTEAQKKAIHKYRIVEHKTRYYQATEFDEKSALVMLSPFSNFTIRPLFLVLSKQDPKRIIEIENVYGVRKTIDIPTKAFTSVAEFDGIMGSLGNFLFTVKSPPFTLLKVKIYEQTRDAEEVKTLGWHRDGAYFFCNGAFKEGKFFPVDDYGILTLPKKMAEDDPLADKEKSVKHYFIPAMSDIYRDSDESYEDEKKFIYIKRPDILFEQWADLFVKVHRQNGMLAMMFYISSLFSDFIYSKLKFFPEMFLFGIPGSGKSTLGWSVSSMFGQPQLPVNLNSATHVALARFLAKFRNAIIWCDEYNNEIDEKKYNILKGAWDRSGSPKGLMDNSTKTTSTPTYSAVMSSGQSLPTRDNSALFTRCILLLFNNPNHSPEAKKNLMQLQELEQKGLSHLTAAMMVFRSKIEEKFLETYEEVFKEFNPLVDEIKISRLVENILVPVTIYKLTCDRLKYPFEYRELKSFVLDTLTTQYRLIASSKETSVFWDLMMYMASNGMIKNPDDYQIREVSSVKMIKDGKKVQESFNGSKSIFYMRMAKIHPLYLKYHREQYNKTGMEKNSLLHYLTSLSCFIGTNDSVRFGDVVTNGFMFDHSMLVKDGYDFERSTNDGRDGDDLTPINPPTPPDNNQWAGGTELDRDVPI